MSLPRPIRVSLAAALPILLATMTAAQAPSPTTSRRLLTPGDLYRLRDVRDPQRSPDGAWVAYVVSSADSATDKNNSDIWMTSWDGRQTVQLTSSPDGESTPRWSPDGKWLAFLSSRGDSSETAQLWLLDRRGGEARKLTALRGDIDDYAWSPDGSRLVLVVEDDPDAASEDSLPADSSKRASSAKKKAKPIVIDRYHFKEDIVGYLTRKRTHLYLFDVATRRAEILTPGAYDEKDPAWSPDGSRIAFVSKRAPPDPDRGDSWDIFLIDARPGANATTLAPAANGTIWPVSGRPAWSPDGKWIAYLRANPDPKLYAYQQNELAITPSTGGAPRVLGTSLDRPVSDPHWTTDGTSVVVLVEDDRVAYPAEVSVRDGRVSRVGSAVNVVDRIEPGSDGAFTVLMSDDTTPNEVYALERGTFRRLSHQNDGWLAGVQLARTQEFASHSSDGTEVHGLLALPPHSVAGQRVPTLLRIHGGPNGQDEHGFSFERQLLADNGYGVVAANYRGSSGRGAKYQSAILADWGHKEVMDLLGAMDWAVRAGIADSSRLGIGGWSYGGILTDYTIASDRRFKAATSGAGSALQLSMYGVDEYITQYAAELGQPWEHQDLWIKLSYPFFHADRIKTPTLFLGGERDFNVPLVGGEQMYQALRVLGVPTQLVIYPNQFHGLTRPSFKVDRLRRYLAWYARWLHGESTTAANQQP